MVSKPRSTSPDQRSSEHTSHGTVKQMVGCKGHKQYWHVSVLGIVGDASSQLCIRCLVCWSLHLSPDSNALLRHGDIPINTSALRVQSPALRD